MFSGDALSPDPSSARTSVGGSAPGVVPAAAPERPAREVGSSVANHAGSRRLAWDALAWLRPRSGLPSVAACRRSTIRDEGARIAIDGATGRAAYAGLNTCGSVWSCPCCSRTIWARRADQLTDALGHTSARGGSALLVTLTMRHDRTQPLSVLWTALAAAWRSVKQSGAVRRTLDGLGGTIGTIRRVEATHGANGWHLHIHAIVLLEQAITPDQLPAITAAYLGPWTRTLRTHGCAPSAEHGVDVKLLDLSSPAQAVAGYITARSTPEALAGELTDALGGKRARRGNRTPWEILQAAMTGDRQARALWHEWETASKGKRALDGLGRVLATLGLDAELSDEQTAASEAQTPDSVIVCGISDGTWRWLSRVPVSQAALLEVAEHHYAIGGTSAAARAVYAQISAWRQATEPPPGLQAARPPGRGRTAGPPPRR